MRLLTFTCLPIARSTQCTPVELPWAEWMQLFSTHAVRGTIADTDDKKCLDAAKDGPAIVLGHVPEGQPRKRENVTSIHALAIDLDHSPQAQVHQIMDKLAPYEYFAWTTHKHGSVATAPHPRVRIILPLETPLTPEQFPDAWQKLDLLIFNSNDPQTKDINRLHYLPSTFDISQAANSHNDGRWLCLADLPDQAEQKFSSADLLRPTVAKLTALKTKDTLKPPAVALLSGQSLAEPGERHATILALTFFIARQNQDLPIEAIEHLFAPSLTAMQTGQDCRAAGVWDAYTGAAGKIKAELRKKQLGDKQPYTPTELATIAARQGWTVEQLNNRWVLNIRNLLYFLDSEGAYQGPYTVTAWWSASPYYLARAPMALGRLDNANNYTAFGYDTIVRLHGSPVAEIISHYSQQFSTYDPKTLVYHQAVRPLNDELSPTFDPGVALWLQKFAGVHHDKLIDWLSCAPDLDKQLCAVYFGGHPGTGKDLFATSLAKLWGGPPIQLDQILRNINGAMALNPVVFINEVLIIPDRFRGKETDVLRMLITQNDRVINPKNEPNQKLLGMLRFVLAANNVDLLNTKAVSTSDALEATAQRFWFVEVGPEAVEVFEKMTLQDKGVWAEKTIPEHFLWIYRNHQIKHTGKRFWVEGDISQMHQMLMIGSKWNSFVCEWLVMWLKSPQKFKSIDAAGDLIRVDEKRQLLVNDMALHEGWALYLKTTIPPDIDKISIALKAISTNRRPQLRTSDGSRNRYRVIILSHLWAWAEQHMVGGLELLKSEVTGIFELEEKLK